MSKLVLEKEFKLPKGWCSSKTIDVMKIIDYRGRTPPYVENGIHHIRSANIKNGKIIWKKIKFVSEETYQKYMTRGIPKEGDILLTTEAPLGKVTLIPKEKFCLAQRLILLRCNEIIFHKFMLYQIMSPNFQRYLTGKKTGTVVTGISSKNFKSLETLIPPLPEQKRIISKIESIFTQIDAGREKLDNVKKLLKQNKQSVLKYVFEGKLTEQWRDKNKSNLELVLKKIELGRKNQNKKLQNIKYDKIENPYTITEKWIWVKIGIISKELQYGTSEKATTIKSKIPVLRMGNIQNGELNFDNLKYYSDNWKNYEQFSLSDGDVLFNRTNSAELVGKTAIYKDCYPSAVFAGYLIRVKIICDAYIPSLLSYYINSIFGKSYINSVVTQQVGQANVNSTKLSMMPLPLMSFEEQKYIISKIESIFGRIDADFIKIKIMGLIYNHLII